MGKRLDEAPLTTRSARLSLPQGLHWRGLDTDVHLGYRKSKRGGKWVVRWRYGVGYRQVPLATADDVFECDGANTLDYRQAAAAARAFVLAARAEEKASREGPAPTVRMAGESYLSAIEDRELREKGKASKLSRSRFNTHIFSDKIADLFLHTLQSIDLIEWRRRTRSKEIKETTLRRISNDFRAALNAARVPYRSRLPDGFTETIKDGFAISPDDPSADSERPNIILKDEQVRKLIHAAAEIDAEEEWEGDLYRIVVGLAATGARFSQVRRIPVADLQMFLERVIVPSSNKGRGQHKRPSASVPIGKNELVVLEQAAAGRSGKEPLFMRWGYRRAGGIKWEKDRRRAWELSELTDPFNQIVLRAGLSSDVTAYALRHSSIARSLRAGLPVRLVAALHDTSSEMIERYYSKFITDAFDAMAAAAVVKLVG